MIENSPIRQELAQVARAGLGTHVRRFLVPALSLCALAVHHTTAHAQDRAAGLTLTEARALARRVNPSLVAARAAVDATLGREKQAGAFPDPVLSYRHEQTSARGATNAQDVALIEQRFEIAGQASRRVLSAQLRRQAAEADLVAAGTALDLEVAHAFASALAADRRVAVADAAADQFEEATRKMAERLSAGDVSGYALRRVRLEAARYAALAAEAHVHARAERLRLATLIGIPPDALVPVDRTADLAVVLDAPADSIEAMAMRHHAGLRAARLRADAGRADARLARRERVPGLVASAGFKNERVLDGTRALSGFVAGLSIALPLWDRRTGSISAADAEATRLAAQAEAVRLRIGRDALTAREALRQTEARVAALDAQLGDEAQAALRAAEAAFAEGEITLVDWLDAVRAYQEAEAAYALVVAESVMQRADLERLLGVTLIR